MPEAGQSHSGTVKINVGKKSDRRSEQLGGASSEGRSIRSKAGGMIRNQWQHQSKSHYAQ